MRYASIDLMRTLAIILMVIVHFLENLSGAAWAPAGFGAPLFGFLVGVSYRIWLESRHARGVSDEQITKSTVRRGLLVFAIGIVFNITVWLPGDTFNWDVLTMIGSAILVLGMLRDLPSAVPILLAALLYTISPLLRIHSGYDEYWTNGYFDPDWTVSQLAMGYFVNGYFPVFPWLYFPLIGLVVGKSLFPTGEETPTPATEKASGKGTEGGPEWDILRIPAFVGIGFALVWCGLRVLRLFPDSPLPTSILCGWTMFPASVEYMTGVTAFTLLLFSLSAWWVDGKHALDRFPGLLSFARTMSQHSFSIYVFHHLIHVWPLWIYGLWSGEKIDSFWQKAMPWPIALALVPVCIALCYLVFRWIERGKRTSLETLLRRWTE